MPKICKHANCKNRVFSGGLCKWHQGYRSNSNLSKKHKSTNSTRDNSKKQRAIREDLRERDRELYLSIWSIREHRCRNCDRVLIGEPLTLYFHHLLEKRNYPEFRHKKWNIMLLCTDCHSGFEVFPNPRKYQKIIEATSNLKLMLDEDRIPNDDKELNFGLSGQGED